MGQGFFADPFTHITNVNFGGGDYLYLEALAVNDVAGLPVSTVTAEFPGIAGGTPGFQLLSQGVPNMLFANPVKLTSKIINHELTTAAGSGQFIGFDTGVTSSAGGNQNSSAAGLWFNIQALGKTKPFTIKIESTGNGAGEEDITSIAWGIFTAKAKTLVVGAVFGFQAAGADIFQLQQPDTATGTIVFDDGNGQQILTVDPKALTITQS